METWKPIQIAPGYEVSDHGRVRSWRVWGARPGSKGRSGGKVIGDTFRLLKLKLNRYGYHEAGISIDCKIRYFWVHRLVAFAFIGPPPEGKQFACHKDGNPLNNTPGNLYWGSPADNAADRVRHGTSPVGEKNPAAKIDRAAVAKVFEMRASGMSQQKIGDMLGLHQTHVSRILLGKIWKHAQAGA